MEDKLHSAQRGQNNHEKRRTLYCYDYHHHYCCLSLMFSISQFKMSLTRCFSRHDLGNCDATGWKKVTTSTEHGFQALCDPGQAAHWQLGLTSHLSSRYHLSLGAENRSEGCSYHTSDLTSTGIILTLLHACVAWLCWVNVRRRTPT